MQLLVCLVALCIFSCSTQMVPLRKTWLSKKYRTRHLWCSVCHSQMDVALISLGIKAAVASYRTICCLQLMPSDIIISIVQRICFPVEPSNLQVWSAGYDWSRLLRPAAISPYVVTRPTSQVIALLLRTRESACGSGSLQHSCRLLLTPAKNRKNVRYEPSVSPVKHVKCACFACCYNIACCIAPNLSPASKISYV